MNLAMNSFGVLDETGEIWDRAMDLMIAKSNHIIALHGAGSFNGISIEDANNLLNDRLIPRIAAYLLDGHVSIIYDGDNDDPDFPDIGHIMGRLRDYFDNRVDCYAVQMQSWYKYRDELPALRPLHSANGNEYRTIVFPDKKFEGDHDHFSQHPRLVSSPNYEQWYVGACGLIASKQLADYSEKAAGALGEHNVVVFKATVSIEQEQKILRKLESETDPENIKRLRDSLSRRAENPYGLLFTPAGEFLVDPQFVNLRIEVVQ
jgi:hypothetical protein